MAVRGFTTTLEPGTAKCVYKAEAGDLSIEIRSAESSGVGDIGASLIATFIVGGPELEEDARAGLHCASGEYDSDTAAGDEWYVLVPNKGPGGKPGTDLSVLVRSKGSKPKSAAKDDAKP